MYLYLAHHLLYNPFMLMLHKLFGFGCDVLAFTSAINAIFAGFSLWVFNEILLIKSKYQKTFFQILFVGSCYGFCRYATENETYVLPLFFSLSGTLFFIRFQKQNQETKNIILSGVFLSIACLFHQIHFWWWLGVLIALTFQQKNLKNLFFYVTPALLVPMVYIIVYYNYIDHHNFKNIFNFIFSDYYNNHADINIGFIAIPLTIINLIRSIIQIHGNFIYLFEISKIFYTPIILLLITAIIFLFHILKTFKIPKNKNYDVFDTAIIWALSLHVLFAFISDGNAEFLVMAPFLLLLIFINKTTQKPFNYLSISVFIWNVTLAISPSFFIKWDNREEICKFYQKEKGGLFILKNKPMVENLYFYKTGIDPALGMVSVPTSKKDLTKIKDSINLYELNSQKVYTDLFIKDKYVTRGSIVNNYKIIIKDFNSYKQTVIENKNEPIIVQLTKD